MYYQSISTWKTAIAVDFHQLETPKTQQSSCQEKIGSQCFLGNSTIYYLCHPPKERVSQVFFYTKTAPNSPRRKGWLFQIVDPGAMRSSLAPLKLRGRRADSLKSWSCTLPETNSSHLKIGHPKRKRSCSNHPFSSSMLVSGTVYLVFWGEKIQHLTKNRSQTERNQGNFKLLSEEYPCLAEVYSRDT